MMGSKDSKEKRGQKVLDSKTKSKEFFFFEDEKYKIEKSVSEEENNYIL